jgi:hypothetical protein
MGGTIQDIEECEAPKGKIPILRRTMGGKSGFSYVFFLAKLCLFLPIEDWIGEG